MIIILQAWLQAWLRLSIYRLVKQSQQKQRTHNITVHKTYTLRQFNSYNALSEKNDYLKEKTICTNFRLVCVCAKQSFNITWSVSGTKCFVSHQNTIHVIYFWQSTGRFFFLSFFLLHHDMAPRVPGQFSRTKSLFQPSLQPTSQNFAQVEVSVEAVHIVPCAISEGRLYAVLVLAVVGVGWFTLIPVVVLQFWPVRPTKPI